MTTPSINYRPATFFAVAATGCVGALLAVGLHSAHATSPRDDPPPAVVHAVPTKGHDHEGACFIKPPTWNVALDGPMPRCHTYVP